MAGYDWYKGFMYRFTPDWMHNCEETGISTVSKTKAKIIAKKSRKQVGSY